MLITQKKWLSSKDKLFYFITLEYERSILFFTTNMFTLLVRLLAFFFILSYSLFKLSSRAIRSFPKVYVMAPGITIHRPFGI
jgi:hypothetical protein